jgi:hypothetical protein
MSTQAKSYPVASGVTVTPGLAVWIDNGEIKLADEAEDAIGFTVDAGGPGDLVTVRYSGEIYAQTDGSMSAGSRVQASTLADGTVASGGGLFGRMLGIALADTAGGLTLVAIGPFDCPDPGP